MLLPFISITLSLIALIFSTASVQMMYSSRPNRSSAVGLVILYIFTGATALVWLAALYSAVVNGW